MEWTILSMLTAGCVFLVSENGKFLRGRRYFFFLEPFNSRFMWMASVFLLALGLGGTNIFLRSRPRGNHLVSERWRYERCFMGSTIW